MSERSMGGIFIRPYTLSNAARETLKVAAASLCIQYALSQRQTAFEGHIKTQ